MFNQKQIHFIGIGGIGVSALARYFLSQGWTVGGSDLVESDLIEELREDGIRIFIGHAPLNLPREAGLVIYSPAVKSNNPELSLARTLKIKTQSYPQALGELTKKYFTIAVSGSHGKSTTTALISLILKEAGLDPTVIIGTKLKEFDDRNFRMGKSKYLVIEADEWDKSFFHYRPRAIVLTNIDKEHLDTYKNFRGVVAGFKKYVEKLPEDGYLIANWGDKNIKKIARSVRKRGVEVVFYNRKKFKRHPLQIPGEHNQLNAEAAWQCAKIFGVKKSTADKVFKSYNGAWRRLELLGIMNQELRIMEKKPMIHDSRFMIHVYSDYAHHPTEIKATLAALRERHRKAKLICVFQPHQQDRLNRLFSDFISAFDEADTAIIMPIYKVEGREEREKRREERGRKDSFSLAQKIREHNETTFYAPDFPNAIKVVKQELSAGGVAVFMSAGDLDSQVRKFLFP